MKQSRQIDYVICLPLLVTVLSPNFPIILAVPTETPHTVTFDPGFDCGNKYWGIKNYQNEVSTNPSIPVFGRLSTDCTDDTEAPAIPENGINITRSYARLHAETADSSSQSVAWQATFQGSDPWGVDATRDGQALSKNDLFPLPPRLNYTLDVSYLWLNDENSRPHGSDDNLTANVLVNLWFAENYNNYSLQSGPGQKPNSMLVIDLAFANLVNINGKWKQDPYLWEGVQYYKPYAEIGDTGEIVYDYSIVMDTDGKNAGVWYQPLPSEYPKSLNQIISDAFSYDYAFEDGTPAPILKAENFNLVELEEGAEVWNYVGGS